ncbi:MAG: biopolymer transporter ExbD [SAR324 cluster bacterium]|nr:biopolymer transporter ExbD [SAR324 cluster bacterium]
MKIAETKPRRTPINLTALIDILFLLIIFFAVSTQFTNQQAVEIKLPKAGQAKSVSTSSRLVILMQSKEKLLLNGQPVLSKNLGSELQGSKWSKEKKVILNIDEKVEHGQVIWLLDLLKQNGFKKVAFGTQLGR